jgi:hypothetical protein
MQIFRQYVLRSDKHRLVAWLDADAPLRVGHLVTLADHHEPERWWEIVHVYATPLAAKPEQRWRVGGLL